MTKNFLKRKQRFIVKCHFVKIRVRITKYSAIIPINILIANVSVHLKFKL